MIIREITPEDNRAIAGIIRYILEGYDLNVPGTAYFDDHLNSLSEYYDAKPDKRKYLIATDDDGNVIGGFGFAEFEGFQNCAELQKLYLVDKYQGKGYGKQLFETVINKAGEMGYKQVYFETHTNLVKAIKLFEKSDFKRIDQPECVIHGTMNTFYIKEL